MIVFLTVISGVLVYILGRIAENFFITPITEQKVILQDIARALTFHGNVICNPGIAEKEMNDLAYEELRELSARLRAKTYGIPKYKFFEKMGWVKKYEMINKIASNLIGISNGIYDVNNALHNSRKSEEILKLLEGDDTKSNSA